MRQVDVIRPGSMYQIIGPVATLKRILNDRQFFIENGVDISVYNRGHFYQTLDQLMGDNKGATMGSKKHCIKEWLDRKAKNSYLLSVALIEYKFRTIKKVVDAYLRLNRSPDIVVLHAEPEAYWLLKALKRRNRSIKIAVFFHNDCIPFQMYLLYYPKIKGTRYWKRMMARYEYIVNNADKLCFICEAGLKNMNRFYPQSENKSALIINGITDLTSKELDNVKKIKSGRTDDKINLCCVGSVSIRKAQRKVIEAMSLLSEENKDKYHLTIVGSGPDFINCKNMVNDEGMEHLVTFTGLVPNVDVYKYLAASDVFLLLSENEGLPISIIEAMRAGLAVISTDVSGIPELVSNNNGVLIEPNPCKLAEILADGSNYDWKQMGRNSRQLFEQKFTFDRMRNDYVKMIDSLS